MTKLVVRLLGGFRVELDGEVVYDFETDKARALLAYLVVEADRPHRRETLSGLLWPDRPDTVARARLRQTLHRVRQALTSSVPTGSAPSRGERPSQRDPPFLFVTSTDVQFNASSDYCLDVAELEAFARQADARTPVHRELLPAALCADFLAGFSVPDSEAFEAWVLNRQEQCHRLAMEILEAQGESFEADGDYEQAVAAARLQLQIEPWLEEAHRRLMRGLALAGRGDEALHQYEACRRALRAELGAEPNAITQALCADIRQGRLLPAARPPQRVERHPSRVGVTPPLQTRPPARLVARADELGQLHRRLEAALAGETGVAFVSGDAGSGKTALLEAFATSAMAECPDLLVAGARCSPGGSLDALAPLRKLAELLFGDLASEAAWRLPERDQVDRLRRATDLALKSLEEHGPDLGGTLVPASSVVRRTGLSTVTAPANRPAGWLAPKNEPKPAKPVTQGTLFDQLLCTLAAICRGQPLLLLLDDLHWVDDATAAFLLHLGRELSDSRPAARRLLVLGAYRPATVSLGRRDTHSGQVIPHPLAAAINELRRAQGEIVVDLDRAAGRAFIEAYVDTEPNRLGTLFRDALYAQTGGHALFTVETLRNLQERGQLFKDEAGRWVAHESLDWGSLPARVEAAIAERIERLPEVERRILSAASVQGDDFSGEVVAELTGSPPREVTMCLSNSLARKHHLVRPEGLQRLGTAQHSTYRFTHHLFQKYLYDELDAIERAKLHAAVAATLDRQIAGDPLERERLGARLAWHYEAGGLFLPAARALLDAGRQAMRVSAFRDALSRFDHGLELLAKEPPSEERAETGRLLEVARLGPERNLEGIGSAGHQSTLARAAAAWAGHRGHPQLMLLMAEMERAVASGRLEDTLAAGERLGVEAVKAGEEDAIGFARLLRGMAHYFAGDVRESESHFDWVLAWLNPERGAGLRAATGIDLEAQALAFSSMNLWLLGYPHQALARSQQAVAAARAAGAAVGEAASLVLGANLLFLLRVDGKAMAEQCEQCLRLCLQQGIGMWRVFAEVLLGRLMIDRGENVAGIERMSNAISAWRAMGMAIGTDAYIAILADGCLAASRLHPAAGDGVRETVLVTGLAGLESMIGPGRPTGKLAYEAELHRLRGELVLVRGGPAAVEEALACFNQAMQLGHERGALAWELRTATSLVRLRQRQGELYERELAEARTCLAQLYARYTEGFAFPDLQDAAALITGECLGGAV